MKCISGYGTNVKSISGYGTNADLPAHLDDLSGKAWGHLPAKENGTVYMDARITNQVHSVVPLQAEAALDEYDGVASYVWDQIWEAFP